MREFLTAFLLVTSIQSTAESSTTEKYFYSLPQGTMPVWGYLAPECTRLDAKEARKLSSCSTVEDHQVCATRSKVELLNGDTNRQQKFNLTYHIFESHKACEKSREDTSNI